MEKLGLAGKLARAFINSKMTILFIIVTIMLGIWAVVMTPKEEEPQIKVPMIDIILQVPGLSPKEMAERVASVTERQMSSLVGVKHVYSTSFNSMTLVTVRFNVGEDLENSLIKVHHKTLGVMSKLPKEAIKPEIKSYTIDDVPFYAITFSSDKFSSDELRYRLVNLAKKLQEISGVSEMSIIGGEKKVVRITPDLLKLKEFGITLLELQQAFEKSSSQFMITPLRQQTPERWLVAGNFIKTIEDIKEIPIGRRFGRTLTVSQVANIEFGFDERKSVVFHNDTKNSAVTVTFTKKKGVNATTLALELKSKLDELLKFESIDPEIKYTITRDYGATAKEKSDELLEHLLLATFSVMILIAIAMSFRVSLVVGIAVPVTLAMTLFIYFMLGYTLNRVTLFALIFSIGILVDDAIVVVENIFRHLSLGIHKLKDRAIEVATDEVGNPTILATFTVILAIMPMAFVGGLMGPYMRPIPIGASLAMFFSLIIAFVVTPWAAKKMIKDIHHHEDEKKGKIALWFEKVMYWMIDKKAHTAIVISFVFVLLLGSFYLVLGKHVKVKMLPFDNKSEFQVLIDLPPGSSLQESTSLAENMSKKLQDYKEVDNIQGYVGVAAPFNFSGMVKHTFMRQSSYMADLQVNLKDKHNRKMQSHDLVKMIRDDFIKEYGHIKDLKIKFLEVPPGPPVMSTLLGEVYHREPKIQRQALDKVLWAYNTTDGVVEVDSSQALGLDELNYVYDRQLGKLHGVPQSFATQTLLMAMGSLDMFMLRDESAKEPIFLRMSLDSKDQRDQSQILSLQAPSLEGDKIELSKIMKTQNVKAQEPIYHKDLRPVMYAMAEVAGEEESPFYAIMKLEEKLKNDFDISYTSSHQSSDRPVLKWDGEMEITWEVFRDLGIAFFIAVILIMVVVIGWYNSFLTPFIIIVPIPLTLIGIIPGHLIFDSFFTATSMIGFIAGAGITVRNSIILVDFIEIKLQEGVDLKTAIVESTLVRFRPILLTALAVIVAAFVILFDPIFSGLAISLMTGSIVSALLSIPLVPILYYWFLGNRKVVEVKE